MGVSVPVTAVLLSAKLLLEGVAGLEAHELMKVEEDVKEHTCQKGRVYKVYISNAQLIIIHMYIII